MRKRITLLVAATMLALTMALGGAGAALAQTQAERACADRGGTIVAGERGTTTCQVTTTVPVQTERSCEVGNSGREGTQQGTVTETTTTTIVFNGSSGNVRSSTTGPTEFGDFEATGPCKNNPGPQR
jgi:hypothetical protein